MTASLSQRRGSREVLDVVGSPIDDVENSKMCTADEDGSVLSSHGAAMFKARESSEGFLSRLISGADFVVSVLAQELVDQVEVAGHQPRPGLWRNQEVRQGEAVGPRPWGEGPVLEEVDVVVDPDEGSRVLFDLLADRSELPVQVPLLTSVVAGEHGQIPWKPAARCDGGTGAVFPRGHPMDVGGEPATRAAMEGESQTVTLRRYPDTMSNGTTCSAKSSNISTSRPRSFSKTFSTPSTSRKR